MRRKWIKIWVDDWLDGSIRKDLNASETGVWADLLAMAGHSRNPGVIQFSQGKPYDHHDLAGRLRRPLPILESTLRKCKAEGRISEDSDGIHITNFFRYQAHLRSEKEDQLPLPEPNEPEQLNPDQLLQQARLDWGAIVEWKHKFPQEVDNRCTQLGPVRVLAAQKYGESQRE